MVTRFGEGKNKCIQIIFRLWKKELEKNNGNSRIILLRRRVCCRFQKCMSALRPSFRLCSFSACLYIFLLSLAVWFKQLNCVLCVWKSCVLTFFLFVFKARHLTEIIAQYIILSCCHVYSVKKLQEIGLGSVPDSAQSETRCQLHFVQITVAQSQFHSALGHEVWLQNRKNITSHFFFLDWDFVDQSKRTCTTGLNMPLKQTAVPVGKHWLNLLVSSAAAMLL